MTLALRRSIVAVMFDARLRLDACVLGLLFGIGLLMYAPVLAIRPLDGDNLYALAWVHAADFGDLLRLDSAIYPEWRPLAYLSLWLEYRLVPLEYAGVHLFVNLTLWTLCAFAVYRIVRELTASVPAAALASLFLLLDRRAASALTLIIDRQMLLALLFGLMAIGIPVRARHRNTTLREALAVGVLLVASALSKEYGLAFWLAIGAFAAAMKQRHTSVAALGAGLTYGAMRLGFAGGAVGPYCEDMGFLFWSTTYCVEPFTPRGIVQMTYNALSSTIGSVVAGVFAWNGAVDPVPARFLISVVFVAFAAIGLARGPRVLAMIALLPVGTGVFSILLFRHRNLLIGLAGVAIIAGVGIASVRLRSVPAWLRPQARAALLAGIILLLCGKAYYARINVTMRVQEALIADPCYDDNYHRPFVTDFVRLVREAYALGDPGCTIRNLPASLD